MWITSLTLNNFRNYEEETFEFREGMNVLYGKNAQGKTNCAEAIYYLCTGTSPRARKDRQMIRTGADGASVSAEAQTKYGTLRLEADITGTGRQLRINGSRIARNADLLGNLRGIFFSPEELRLVQGGPDERRRFMNISLSQLSRSYYTALVRYNKILAQRNALLKERDVSLVLETLPVWDVQLCRYAAEIAQKRREFVEGLAPVAAEKHAFLTDGKEALTVSFESRYRPETLGDELAAGYERDIRQGVTGTGPHRDDLKICINGEDARSFGSQGQARTCALSLKLAETEIFRRQAGEPPVLILDDVMSELDLSRRRKLLAEVDGLQTVLTCTHTEKVLFGREVNKIRIVAGKIKR